MDPWMERKVVKECVLKEWLCGLRRALCVHRAGGQVSAHKRRGLRTEEREEAQEGESTYKLLVQ